MLPGESIGPRLRLCEKWNRLPPRVMFAWSMALHGNIHHVLLLSHPIRSCVKQFTLAVRTEFPRSIIPDARIAEHTWMSIYMTWSSHHRCEAENQRMEAWKQRTAPCQRSSEWNFFVDGIERSEGVVAVSEKGNSQNHQVPAAYPIARFPTFGARSS